MTSLPSAGTGRLVAAALYHRRVAAKRSVSVAAVSTAASTAALAVVLIVVAAAFAGADPSEHGAPPGAAVWGVTILTVIAQSALLLWRRRIADVALLVIAALPVGLALLAPGVFFTATALPVIVAAFSAGIAAPLRSLRWWALGAVVLVATGQFLDTSAEGHTDVLPMLFQAAAQAVVVVGLPLLPAAVVSAQRVAREAREETLAALTRERDAQLGEAVARERTAMARELHDIAAHHLSGISIMAAAVARQAGIDPDAAREGALRIRAQSNAVLEDLRKLVGLLRSSESGETAVETLHTVPALVEAARLAGAEVDLEVIPRDGADLGRGINPLAQLAAHRMVQESLTNAARYAPGARCCVAVDDSQPERLTLTVENLPPAPGARPAPGGSGFGILGMRERATLTGGSFEAGPTEDGGWVVRMTLPRDHAERAIREGS